MGIALEGIVDETGKDSKNSCEDLSIEKEQISQLITETPRSDKGEVMRYHKRIIQRIDSGKIIPIPSEIHRSLHQLIWIEGYKVYNQIYDSNKGSMEFIHSSQRGRFDMWYAHNYILSKLTPWERDVVADASKTCLKKYQHPIEELNSDEIKVE